MNYDRFIGLVQQRAQVGTTEESVSAIRATLTALAERLHGGAAHNLAAQLPREIGFYLEIVNDDLDFNLDAFYNRVAEVEPVDRSAAEEHAKAVMSVLVEAVTPAEMVDVMAQLPKEFDELIEAAIET